MCCNKTKKKTSRQTGLSAATVNPILLQMCICVHLDMWMRALPGFEVMMEGLRRSPYLARINYCVGKRLCLQRVS